MPVAELAFFKEARSETDDPETTDTYLLRMAESFIPPPYNIAYNLAKKLTFMNQATLTEEAITYGENSIP